MIPVILTDREVRVLGCLIEKEVTTPDYYPLSLNALRNACNQTSNREPVLALDEATVADALETLKQKNLVLQDNFSRVAKFEEVFLKTTRLMPPEAAIMCVLMLRGPQTGGELRTRTERLHGFDTSDAVSATLQQLQEWAYVTLLPRQVGKKEPRYAHLLSGPPEMKPEEKPALPRSAVSDFVAENEAFIKLQSEVASLRQEHEDLKQAFLDFKAQF